ncbi:glucose-6-phosphate isomerase [Candidatus Pelagibacter sp.]|jgi:glucose-6-phosphate isomerase|nr:glucose-6-phosphate isomerase [Candidatus Pelagibacter sp.]MDB4081962.1 glucose-6-phosphate isomerase [Candidatus Pelagibacter sp.]
MLTKYIDFKNFILKKNNKKIKKDLDILLKENNTVLKSLSPNYKNTYSKETIIKLKKYPHIRIIGMGGSILGTEAIYNFFKKKIKKNFYFNNNLQSNIIQTKKKNFINLIVSKSGNTLETISNSNVIIKSGNKNIFLTENKESYLYLLANKLKAEIIHHNNFIGGRYSVLSEVGMLPAELMGLNANNFKQLNNLVKNKKFINSLIINVNNTLHFLKQKKFNSIILNYDESSNSLFQWYQQLIAESLGKKGKGILPIISTMPKDNHSVMQLYLDGPKNNFFTFFYVKEKNSNQINKNMILSSYNYLKNKNLAKIILSQKLATEKVFLKKKIPFRSFEIINRDEKTLGELFCFFILETIMLGRALKVNPYDQPSVELIKKETKKILF